MSKIKAKIHDGYLSIYMNGECMYCQPLNSLVFYSLTRPFEVEDIQWNLESLEESDELIRLVLSDGKVKAELEITYEYDAVKLQVSYENISNDDLFDFTAGVALDCLEGTKHKATLPHIIYNDNPSADPERIVPHIGNEHGKGVIVEENRLPIPAANVEWLDDEFYSLTFLMLPEVKYGYDIEYWSMGILREKEGEKMVALSGPLMFNGLKDVYYGGRNTPLPYLNGYRTLAVGEKLGKTFYIGFEETTEGRGFRSLVNLGYKVLKPEAVRQHTLDEMIEYKKNVMDSRYYEDEDCCGYICFGKANTFGNVSGRPEYFLYGWTGQAIKLAWCDFLLGVKENDKARMDRAIRTVDFYVKHAEVTETPGLIKGYYMIEKAEMRPEWRSMEGGIPSRIEGEALIDLADLMELMKENGVEVPDAWESFLRRTAEFLSRKDILTEDKIYPVAWNPDGSAETQIINSAGISCIVALAKAGKYFNEKKYLDAAIERYEVYYDIHMKTFEIPFSRATMDARCEDKESCIYFFKAAAFLYEVTGDKRFDEDAAIAADWLLTFIYFWDTGFQPGTVCNKMNFKSTGWPGVSVQNHHLDVFFPTYELFEYGVLSKREFYCKMAENIAAALTYGVAAKVGDYDYSVIGEQGEQYYQTNYFQVKYPKIIELTRFYRGGMQVWNPSWITAQVLQSSLLFKYNK